MTFELWLEQHKEKFITYTNQEILEAAEMYGPLTEED